MGGISDFTVVEHSTGHRLEGDMGDVVSLNCSHFSLFTVQGKFIFTEYSIANIALSNIVSLLLRKSSKTSLFPERPAVATFHTCNSPISRVQRSRAQSGSRSHHLEPALAMAGLVLFKTCSIIFQLSFDCFTHHHWKLYQFPLLKTVVSLNVDC